MRDVLALPTRLGGLGITKITQNSDYMFQASERITAPLVDLIVNQDLQNNVDVGKILSTIKQENRQRQHDRADGTYERLDPQLKRCIDLAVEKGSSSWLNTLPIAEHGFHLHKGEFRDALCLRHGWSLKNVPQSCLPLQ